MKRKAFSFVMAAVLTVVAIIGNGQKTFAASTGEVAAIVENYFNNFDADSVPKYVVECDLNNDGVSEYIAASDKLAYEYGILIYQQNNAFQTFDLGEYGGDFFISSQGDLCREYWDGANINIYIWEFTPDNITAHRFRANGDFTNMTNCMYNDTPLTLEEFNSTLAQFGLSSGTDENYLREMENIMDSLLSGGSATAPVATPVPAAPVQIPATLPAPLPVTAAPPATTTAIPTAATVVVNGAGKAFEAYNIGGNNYFKLRDLALAINGTPKQFAVGFDSATNAISLLGGQPYIPDGSEMQGAATAEKPATLTTAKIFINGAEMNLTVYNIGGNNFFKLRDVMQAFNVFTGYDGQTGVITIDTNRDYVPE